MGDHTDFFRMLARMIRAGGRRAGSADEHDLREFALLKDELDLAIRNAVKDQLGAGKSWSDIALAFGCSRQAAFKRYGK